MTTNDEIRKKAKKDCDVSLDYSFLEYDNMLMNEARADERAKIKNEDIINVQSAKKQIAKELKEGLEKLDVEYPFKEGITEAIAIDAIDWNRFWQKHLKDD
jgi:hypothetical protein